MDVHPQQQPYREFDFMKKLDKLPHVIRAREAIARGDVPPISNSPFQQALKEQRAKALELEKLAQQRNINSNSNSKGKAAETMSLDELAAKTMDGLYVKLNNDPHFIAARQDIASGKYDHWMLSQNKKRQDMHAPTNIYHPCSSHDVRPITKQVANELITKIPDWQLVNEDGKLKLSRSWKVDTITQGLDFIEAIADAAKAEGQHPDLHLVGLNNVAIELWTPSVGGVTENDFTFATKIDCLVLAHL